jgi:hypothetical protein
MLDRQLTEHSNFPCVPKVLGQATGYVFFSSLHARGREGRAAVSEKMSWQSALPYYDRDKLGFLWLFFFKCQITLTTTECHQ